MAFDLLFQRSTSPFICGVPWGPGFGALYASPATLPASSGRLDRTPSSLGVHDVLVGDSAGITGYPWAVGVGFGAKYSTFSPGVTVQGGITVAPLTGTAAVICAGSNPASPGATVNLLRACAWTPGAGPGGSLGGATVPSLALSQQAQAVDFSPLETAVAAGLANYFSPGAEPMVTYPWSGGFGAKHTAPGTPATSGVQSVKFSALGGAVVGGHSALPRVTGYPFSGGLGAKYANPSPIPASLTSPACSFSPDNAYIAIATTSSPFIYVYAWSDGGGFGAKVSDPSTLPTVGASLPKWTDDGAQIVMGSLASPFAFAYPWSAGFGAKYADPSLGGGSFSLSALFVGSSVAPPSPTQPDGCGPKNLAPKPLRLIDPEPVVKVYPHVTEIGDWAAQQSIKLLWDRLHDHESRLRAGLANDQQWVTAANSAADAAQAAQLTADHALAQASAASTAAGGDTGGGESGGDGGSPDDPEAGDGFNNRFATGHPPALPVPLTSYTAGQIVGGVANEFPALFANYPSDAETVAACQEYVLRTIWHLQQAGFTAGRQRNPSLLISNDKITIFIDGTYRAYDIASLGGAGSPNVAHILRVSPADYVADAGTPD